MIRGLSNCELERGHGKWVILMELGISSILAGFLFVVSFVRVYFTHFDLLSAIAISSSLFTIVIFSVFLGTLIPIVLDHFNIDPAHSAAPFLATLTDILGMLIYCIICNKML